MTVHETIHDWIAPQMRFLRPSNLRTDEIHRVLARERDNKSKFAVDVLADLERELTIRQAPDWLRPFLRKAAVVVG